MRNMKGFIFTLDALFALIIASLGVSIILYVRSEGLARCRAAAYSYVERLAFYIYVVVVRQSEKRWWCRYGPVNPSAWSDMMVISK